MPNPNPQLVTDRLTQGVAKASGKSIDFVKAYGAKYGPRAAGMLAEGADDFRMLALAKEIQAELALNGIRVETDAERAARTILEFIKSAL